MSRLAIYQESGEGEAEVIADEAAIAQRLSMLGVRFERWEASKALSSDADQAEVLAAYEADVKRLSDEYGFKSVDVVSLRPDHPQKRQMREKFLNEHIHSDFEVRFFVDGSGLFYLHVGDKIYMVLCERGDLISVPAGTAHWFDMGENPDFKCIRLFTVPEGWVAEFTDSGIARRFPTYDEFIAA